MNAAELQETLYWLALHRINGVGPATYLKILNIFPSITEVFLNSDTTALNGAGLSSEVIQQVKSFPHNTSLRRQLDKDLRWLAADGHSLLKFNDPAYPLLLKQITNPPPLLFVSGAEECLSQLQLGMVGSRKSSLIGRETARLFARQLSDAGLVISSGLALGIDAECHRGALAGAMPTVAVLGTGVDRVYPARHRDLAEKILANGGAVISEFPLGTQALPANFPRRNRIISGLSLGILVVEANLKSGSLITARYAAEQNREVFAIPGSIHNQQSRGCHALIQQGAKLVTGIADILEELTGLSEFQRLDLEQTTSSGLPQEFGRLESRVLEKLSDTAMDLDKLVESTKIPVHELMSTLVNLELRGQIKANAGAFIRIPRHLQR